MKVVIFAGGYGTRFGHETDNCPKPMIGIGGKPILSHLMDYYRSFGFDDFVILAGYRQDVIKDYFLNEGLNGSKAVKFVNSSPVVLDERESKGSILVLDTGNGTPTGERLLKARKFLEDEPFLLTYGDGLSDVDIPKTIEELDAHDAYCVLTAYRPVCQFGGLDIAANGTVTSFREKSKEDSPWINAGFMACRPDVFRYVDIGEMFETALGRMALDGKLHAHKHEGNWACMDCVKDKENLEKEWATGAAFWTRHWDEA